MTNYEVIQTRKVISAYGGVGSLVEFPNGAMIIENFDKWSFFEKGIHKQEQYHILDNRLLNRLRTEKGFPSLIALVMIPINTSNYFNKSIPAEPQNVISANYFPKWFFCPKCNRFKHLNDWWNIWKNNYKGSDKRKPFFQIPKCGKCYASSKLKRKYFELQQVRFILTSNKGNIEDIPWKKWNTAKISEEKGSPIILDFDNLCCEKQDLRYIQSKKYFDYSGIRIECKSCGIKNTLGGLFGLRLGSKEEKELKKPVIRSSNSVYYPVIINSLYLPTQLEISEEDREKIDLWLNKNKSIEFMYDALLEKYHLNVIHDYINEHNSNEFIPEDKYRLSEYKFLTDSSRKAYSEDRGDNKSDLIFEKQKISDLYKFSIENLIKINRLKVTSVQTAYSRQQPIDSDQLLSGESTDLNIQSKPTSKWGKNTEYLPAVENFGEGIFISFDEEQIISWVSSVKKLERLQVLMQNISNNDMSFIKGKFKTIEHLAKFMLIHTLSHILIKEFEYSVGYPSASIQERLFIDENEMSGLLLYTIAGAEGSYGGLIKHSSEKLFNKIFKSAIIRAKDCSSDPICYNTQDGQGIGGLNMASCYSCALLPETSCEEFNSFLDRFLLVDEEYGFFKL